MEQLLTALSENWESALVLFLVFVKGILNLIPSEQPIVVFSFIDWLIDYLVPNRLQKKAKNTPKK